MTGRPLPGVDVNADVGYTRTNIRNLKGTSDVVQSPPAQPRSMFNLGVQYRHQLNENISLTPRIDFSRFGKTCFHHILDPNRNEYLRQHGYNLVDTQL